MLDDILTRRMILLFLFLGLKARSNMCSPNKNKRKKTKTFFGKLIWLIQESCQGRKNRWKVHCLWIQRYSYRWQANTYNKDAELYKKSSSWKSERTIIVLEEAQFWLRDPYLSKFVAETETTIRKTNTGLYY